MSTKHWWNSLTQDERRNILRETNLPTDLAIDNWEVLGFAWKSALNTYRANHSGTVVVIVKEWSKNEDVRKNHYCECGALLRGSGKCWRCDK